MALAEEKLMKYLSFCEYIKDNLLKLLFKSGQNYGNRYIMKVDENAITHTGNITVRGSLNSSRSPTMNMIKYKQWIISLLRSEVEQLWYSNRDLHISWSATPIK